MALAGCVKGAGGGDLVSLLPRHCRPPPPQPRGTCNQALGPTLRRGPHGHRGVRGGACRGRGSVNTYAPPRGEEAGLPGRQQAMPEEGVDPAEPACPRWACVNIYAEVPTRLGWACMIVPPAEGTCCRFKPRSTRRICTWGTSTARISMLAHGSGDALQARAQRQGLPADHEHLTGPPSHMPPEQVAHRHCSAPTPEEQGLLIEVHAHTQARCVKARLPLGWASKARLSGLGLREHLRGGAGPDRWACRRLLPARRALPRSSAWMPIPVGERASTRMVLKVV